MALILQATVPPTALAARNEIMEFSGEEENNQATNGVNVLAMVLDVDPPRNCIPRGGICLVALSESGVHHCFRYAMLAVAGTMFKYQ
ncbi:hypothetical protein GQ457_12G002810 [Hibiscus cannabinus]